MNMIIVSGILVSDPQLRYAANGTPLWNGRLASNTGRDRDRPETLFIDVVGFGQLAERIAEMGAKKGWLAACSGRLTTDEWTDQKTGEKRSRIKLLANVITVSPRENQRSRDDRDEEGERSAPPRTWGKHQQRPKAEEKSDGFGEDLLDDDIPF